MNSPQLRQQLLASAVLVGTLVVAIVAAQVVVDSRMISSTFIAAPSDVLLSIPGAASVSSVPMLDTLAEVALSFLLSLAIGITAGLLIGNFSLLYRTSNGVLTALYSVPKITILPAMVLWLGLGTNSVVSFATLESCIPITLLVTGAVRGFDERLVVVAKAIGATPVQIQTKVMLPGMRPQLLASIQIGLVFSVIGVILAQMFLGAGGVGTLLLNDAYELQVSQLYAVSILFALVVVAILTAFRVALERVASSEHASLNL